MSLSYADIRINGRPLTVCWDDLGTVRFYNEVADTWVAAEDKDSFEQIAAAVNARKPGAIHVSSHAATPAESSKNPSGLGLLVAPPSTTPPPAPRPAFRELPAIAAMSSASQDPSAAPALAAASAKIAAEPRQEKGFPLFREQFLRTLSAQRGRKPKREDGRLAKEAWAHASPSVRGKYNTQAREKAALAKRCVPPKQWELRGAFDRFRIALSESMANDAGVSAREVPPAFFLEKWQAASEAERAFYIERTRIETTSRK